jgi:hypothetical protein
MICTFVLAVVAGCAHDDGGSTSSPPPARFWYCVAHPEMLDSGAAHGTDDRWTTTCFRDRAQCEHFVTSGGTCLVATVAWCTTTSGPICVADKTFCDSVSSQNHGTACALTAP